MKVLWSIKLFCIIPCWKYEQNSLYPDLLIHLVSFLRECCSGYWVEGMESSLVCSGINDGWQDPSQKGSMHSYVTCHAFACLPEDKSTNLGTNSPVLDQATHSQLGCIMTAGRRAWFLILYLLCLLASYDPGIRALRHCSLCLYVKLGQMRQTQT